MASRRHADGAAVHARRTRERVRKVGWAVVGLGHLAQTAVLPAFRNARRNSRLVALVSGDRRKREELGRLHGVRASGYEDLDEVLAARDVDAVYIATPNTRHTELVLRAARAGVHVLVEKPMAVDGAECEAMIRAAREHDVRLMVAYRLHFERAFLGVLDDVARGLVGEPRFLSSTFSYQIARGNIRTQAALGGGALWDLGPYCVNAARHLFQAEPLEVRALVTGPAGDARFAEVPEAWSALLRFPGDRLAQFTTSFGAAATDGLRVVGTRGDIRLEPAFDYALERVRTTTVGEGATRELFPVRDQFGPQLLYFAECVLEDREPEPGGEEGLADVRVLEAIRDAARSGAPVRIAPVARRRRPSLHQAIDRAPVRTPVYVDVHPPQGD